MLKSARRNEELEKLFQQEAAALAASPLPQREGPGAGTLETGPLYLANYLLNQSVGVLENNERLALLDALEPVFARQPEHLLAKKHWQWQRAEFLSQCGREDEAFSLFQDLAEAYPRDLSMQVRHLQNLQNRQEFAAVRTWIDRVLTSGTPWEPQEIDQLRDIYASSLRSQERYEELAAYLAHWIEQNPEHHEPYYQYLDAILYNDHVEEAYALVDKWFQEARRDDIAPAAAARLDAAILWILISNNWNGFGTDKGPEYWQRQLIETVAFFARHETQYSISGRILDDWVFRQTEAYRQAREKLAKNLRREFRPHGRSGNQSIRQLASPREKARRKTGLESVRESIAGARGGRSRSGAKISTPPSVAKYFLFLLRA